MTQIETAERRAPTSPIRISADQRRAIAAELAYDGRAGTTELAARLGMAPRRVRDAIAEMRESGRLAIRVRDGRSHRRTAGTHRRSPPHLGHLLHADGRATGDVVPPVI
ncbi:MULTISPECIES: hypothetical protein [unclassified Microbacterium]|uniref:hypothetical protein n=1 Tax=unclassified Microbacterium TaxID=2609290 RepID=UPI0011C3E398|nr:MULTISPECIES: hypothetical protein [unclassified Microbacterium]MBT2484269.1 hypothetical protein [Microbacterium sp. ISL-108]